MSFKGKLERYANKVRQHSEKCDALLEEAHLMNDTVEGWINTKEKLSIEIMSAIFGGWGGGGRDDTKDY